MRDLHAVTASAFCTNHQVDLAFIELLSNNNLITTWAEAGEVYIAEDNLPELEKLVTMHYELQINVEGIETIAYLLNKMQRMQYQLNEMQNKLAVYESLFTAA